MATRIDYRGKEPVGWIRLAGPDRLNVIGTETYTELAATMRAIEGGRSVGAVVIYGTGAAFSAGADIDELRGFADRDAFETFIHGFADALDVIAASRLPVIAAVHGCALGGGLELALACDLRLATPDAKLGLPEAKLGLLPGAGGTQRLTRMVPAAVATEMLMLGDTITGERAYELGLVNRLSERESLRETAEQMARRLAAGSAAVASSVKVLRASTGQLSLAEGIERERAVVAGLFDTADAREGVTAFLEKRAPCFTGR